MLYLDDKIINLRAWQLFSGNIVFTFLVGILLLIFSQIFLHEKVNIPFNNENFKDTTDNPQLGICTITCNNKKKEKDNIAENQCTKPPHKPKCSATWSPLLDTSAGASN